MTNMLVSFMPISTSRFYTSFVYKKKCMNLRGKEFTILFYFTIILQFILQLLFIFLKDFSISPFSFEIWFLCCELWNRIWFYFYFYKFSSQFLRNLSGTIEMILDLSSLWIHFTSTVALWLWKIFCYYFCILYLWTNLNH